MRRMLPRLFAWFGYAKFPPEAVELCVLARHLAETNPTDPRLPDALRLLERFHRSCQRIAS